MKQTVSISVLPPKIKQFFLSNLLQTPAPLRETSDDLIKRYMYLKHKLLRKSEKMPKRKAICDKLILEFMDLYERAKAKEEELKTKTGHHTQRPFYWIRSIGQKDESLFDRLKY